MYNPDTCPMIQIAKFSIDVWPAPPTSKENNDFLLGDPCRNRGEEVEMGNLKRSSPSSVLIYLSTQVIIISVLYAGREIQ